MLHFDHQAPKLIVSLAENTLKLDSELRDLRRDVACQEGLAFIGKNLRHPDGLRSEKEDQGLNS